jgi:hypothetical protein
MKRTTLIMVLIAALSPAARSLTNVPANAVSSSKHYRNSGVGNATGRAGSATMTARALLGKDGTTTVEVTTGALDSPATPPGSFSKVQYKPLNSTGNALFAQNFDPPSNAGGYYSFVSPSLHRAEQIQLQGNIAGIDNRNDVVTLVETVKLRPDLGAQGLMIPDSALVNQPVNISANIVELNGDASATTTCVLAIDGNNVDRANNVYVDAGGTVSCTFVYTFSTTGSHTIQVTSSDVVPADWDLTNNSVSGAITINSPGSAEHAFGTFSGSSFGNSTTSTNELWYAGNVLENVSYTYNTQMSSQSTSAIFNSFGCAGSTDAAMWQYPVNLTYTESMDGVPAYSFTELGLTGFSVSVPTNFSICNSTATSYSSVFASYIASDHFNYISSIQYYDGAGNAIYLGQGFQSTRNAGSVTYLSSLYQCYYWNSPSGNCNEPSDYYVWNTTSGQEYGTVIPVGNIWVPSITSQDAGGNKFSGSISVPIVTSGSTYNSPSSCYGYGPDVVGYAYQNCASSTFVYSQSSGAANY